mmetsp:Transcript_124833/g.249281  ORF Transcript_124833/g.249281 Transcript_124833/m.249281 type:complete len:253 (+) Transcript_124833:56-814(+)
MLHQVLLSSVLFHAVASGRLQLQHVVISAATEKAAVALGIGQADGELVFFMDLFNVLMLVCFMHGVGGSEGLQCMFCRVWFAIPRVFSLAIPGAHVLYLSKSDEFGCQYFIRNLICAIYNQFRRHDLIRDTKQTFYLTPQRGEDVHLGAKVAELKSVSPFPFGVSVMVIGEGEDNNACGNSYGVVDELDSATNAQLDGNFMASEDERRQGLVGENVAEIGKGRTNACRTSPSLITTPWLAGSRNALLRKPRP